jgi:hypothetical protein
MLIAHLITPADVLQRGCFEEFIDAHGGATSRELEMTDQYEKDRNDTSTLPLFMVHGAETGDFGDTKRNTALRADLPLIIRLLEELPIIITVKTMPEIAATARRLGLAPAELAIEPINTGTQIDDLKAQCNEGATQLKKLRFIRQHGRVYRGGNDNALWGTISSDVWIEAKRNANIGLAIKLEQITDVAALERLRAEIDLMTDREMGL